MDSDSFKREQDKECAQEKSDDPEPKKRFGNRKPNVRNVLPSIRVRHSFFDHNEANKFLLDYGFYFLLPVGSFLYITFFLFK